MITIFDTPENLKRLVVAIDSGSPLPDDIAQLLKTKALLILKKDSRYNQRDLAIRKLGQSIGGSNYQKAIKIKKLFLDFKNEQQTNSKYRTMSITNYDKYQLDEHQVNSDVTMKNKYPACYRLIYLIYNSDLTVPCSERHIARILEK